MVYRTPPARLQRGGPGRGPVRGVLAIVLATLMLLVLSVSTALAAGGNGASFCSNAGAPTGSDTPWLDGGNPGETSSWLAHHVGFDGGFNPGNAVGGSPAGQAFCNPNYNPGP